MVRLIVFAIFTIFAILKTVVSYTTPVLVETDIPNLATNSSEGIPTTDCNGCRSDLPGLRDFLKSQKIAHRIEYIQQQLISNLHIQNPSNGTPRLDALPEFLLEQLIHPTAAYSDTSSNVEEAKPRQVVLFPEEETVNCLSQKTKGEDTLCVRFKLSDELLSAETSSAVIWVNREHLGAQPHSLVSFTVSELIPWNIRNPINRTLTVQQVHDKDGWYQIDLGTVVRTWQLYKEVKQRTIMISCDGCNLQNKYDPEKKTERDVERAEDENCNQQQRKNFTDGALSGAILVGEVGKDTVTEAKIELRKDRTPFLLLSTEPEKNMRAKRGVDCTPGQQECCREDLLVDFQMLSEDYRMIYHPSKFNAYVCRGNCYYHSFTDSHTPYSGLLTLLKARGQQDVSFRAACCTPTKFSSLQVFYASDNSTIEQKMIPNVIVEACGCI